LILHSSSCQTLLCFLSFFSTTKNPTEFWKILNSLKEKGEYPSTSISPQDWFAYFKDLMNKKYTSNYSVNDFCKYLHCNNDQLNSDITAEEMMKAVSKQTNPVGKY
jgi:glucuronate isomerase